MTEQGARAAARWQDPEYARRWSSNDRLAEMLALPRSIAAAAVARDRPSARLIIDAGSGPGDFLAVMLEEFPGARGVWTDASPAMREIAGRRLAPYAGRVDFILADMTDLGAAPAGADVVITSRATHHLGRDGLPGFYAGAVARLAPGGWLVNLDHVGVDEVWDARLRAIRDRFWPPSPTGAGHRHSGPLPGIADHLAGFAAAGVSDVAMVWRAFATCLFMGRVSG